MTTDALAAPSPFLEGTNVQLVWDSTSLGMLKECSRKYYYSMIEGWRPKAQSIHLTFGIIYHSALELYYKLRAVNTSHDDATIAAAEYTLRESWGMPADNPNKNRETLVRTVIWYLEEFRDDKATTIILADGRPAVELTFKFDLGYGPGPGYAISGHIDRLVTFSDQQYVMDHKTTKQTLSKYYYQGYSPDNQMSLYTIAAQVVFNTTARGVIIDAAQVAVGFSRFDRGIAYRRPSELEEWMNDMRWYLEMAARNAESGHWPMNDKACRMCHFRDVCSKEVSFRPVILNSDFVKDPWNPMKLR